MGELSLLELFFQNTPAGRWLKTNALKLGLILLAILAVSGAVMYGIHVVKSLQHQHQQDLDQLALKDQVLGQQRQQIADRDAQLLASADALRKAQSSSAITNQTEIAVAKETQDIRQKQAVASNTVHAYVKTVSEDTSFTPPQKTELISKAYIDHLWHGYCLETDSVNPTCVRYGSIPQSDDAAPAPAVTPPPTPALKAVVWKSHRHHHTKPLVAHAFPAVTPVHEEIVPTRCEVDLTSLLLAA